MRFSGEKNIRMSLNWPQEKLGVAPEHCIVFDDVLPAIKSARAARMLAGGIYDKYSADQRTEIERIADIYLLDFRQAPIPHKEV